jgi:hypothetical protein
MKDTFCSRFFLEPTQTLHRRYEALRAVFVDQPAATDGSSQALWVYVRHLAPFGE